MTKDREVGAKDIFDAARLEDAFSLDLIEYEAEYIALGLGNILNVIETEDVDNGGRVSMAEPILFDKVKKKKKKYALPSTLENLKIITAELGNDAGILGAAYLGMQ